MAKQVKTCAGRKQQVRLTIFLSLCPVGPFVHPSVCPSVSLSIYNSHDLNLLESFLFMMDSDIQSVKCKMYQGLDLLHVLPGCLMLVLCPPYISIPSNFTSEGCSCPRCSRFGRGSTGCGPGPVGPVGPGKDSSKASSKRCWPFLAAITEDTAIDCNVSAGCIWLQPIKSNTDMG